MDLQHFVPYQRRTSERKKRNDRWIVRGRVALSPDGVVVGDDGQEKESQLTKNLRMLDAPGTTGRMRDGDVMKECLKGQG
ncbi:MAG: hypothetical protein M4579_007388, partial [Chaenotheca gracillima]